MTVSHRQIYLSFKDWILGANLMAKSNTTQVLHTEAFTRKLLPVIVHDISKPQHCSIIAHCQSRTNLKRLIIKYHVRINIVKELYDFLCVFTFPFKALHIHCICIKNLCVIFYTSLKPSIPILEELQCILF